MVHLFVLFKDVSKSRFYEVSNFVDIGLYLMIIIQLIQLLLVDYVAIAPLFCNLALLVSALGLWLYFRSNNTFENNIMLAYYGIKNVLYCLLLIALISMAFINPSSIMVSFVILMCLGLPMYWNFMMLMIVLKAKGLKSNIENPNGNIDAIKSDISIASVKNTAHQGNNEPNNKTIRK